LETFKHQNNIIDSFAHCSVIENNHSGDNSLTLQTYILEIKAEFLGDPRDIEGA